MLSVAPHTSDATMRYAQEAPIWVVYGRTGQGLIDTEETYLQKWLALGSPVASSDSAFTLLSCASSPRLLGNPGRRGVRYPATISNDAVNSLKRSQHSACRVRHLDPGADPTQRLDIEGCAHWSAVGVRRDPLGNVGRGRDRQSRKSRAWRRPTGARGTR